MRLVVLALTLAALLAPATVRAADRLYWADYISGQVRVANLDGSGSPQTLFDEGTPLSGIALDPAAGKIYWSQFINLASPGTIRVGNLDGTGSPQTVFGEAALGIAVDPAARQIYWGTGGQVRRGSLDDPTSAQTLFNEPAYGVAIDPAAGMIYWTNLTDVRSGPLGGGVPSHQLFPTESQSYGIALDPSRAEVFWTINTGPTSGRVRFGNLDGTASAKDLFASPNENNPFGVALDPTTGKIYWSTGSQTIRVANIENGVPADLISNEGGSPRFLAILRAPVGTGAPQVTGGNQAGQQLSCGGATWAGDVLGAFFYRSPTSVGYQWLRDGADVAGATTSSYTPSAGGGYSCRTTASNAAGSSSQTSAAHAVAAPPGGGPGAGALPSFGTLTLVTLKLGAVTIAAAGPLKIVVSNGNGFPITGVLSGQTVKPVSVARARRISLKAKAFAVAAHAKKTVSLKLPKSLQRFLKRKHRLALRLTAKLKDPAGHTRTLRKTVTLKLKRR